MFNQPAALPELSIVIPIFKNADTLDELHRRLVQSMQKLNLPYEILFVNDASPDKSLLILKRLASQNPNVGFLSLQSNVGQNLASLTGLRYARGNFALIMDGDLQDPPEAIPALWQAIQTPPPAAVVFAGKKGKYESQDRLFAAFAFKHLLHWLCGTPFDAGGFCLMNREMIVKLIGFPAKRPYLLSMIGSCGLAMKSIPVVRSVRPAGESAYTTWKRFRLGCSGINIALQFRWRRLPWKFSPGKENELPILTVMPPGLNQDISTDV